MEAPENCVENGKPEDNYDPMEQQYETKKQNLMNHEEVENKSFDFEAHFIGNGVGSSDEYDDERSVENR